MLLSKSSQHPNGIGNSSQHVGHNFCEHVMGPGVTGIVKDLVGQARTLDDGHPGGFYLPRFRNLRDKSNFIRGYGFEGESGTTIYPGHAFSTPGFGAVQESRCAIMPAPTSTWAASAKCWRGMKIMSSWTRREGRVGYPSSVSTSSSATTRRKWCDDMAESAKEMFEEAGIEIIRVGAGDANARLVDS